MFDSIIKQVQGWVKLKGDTDGTMIGNVTDKLKTNLSAISDGASPKDFLYEIRKGSHPKLSLLAYWGHNPAVKASKESIWHFGGIVPWLSTASVLTISSDSTSDVGGSTGAAAILITGLDTNWDVITETVVMNGTTDVLTTQAFLRINEAVVVSAGSARHNVGNISMDVGGTTYEYIGSGHSLLHSAKFSVPRNHRAYIIKGAFQTDENVKGKALEVFVRNNTLNVDFSSFPIRVASDFILNPASFAPLDEKIDLVANANLIGGAGTVEMSASITIILEDLT